MADEYSKLLYSRKIAIPQKYNRQSLTALRVANLKVHYSCKRVLNLNMNGTIRADIKPGIVVNIILKTDQRSCVLTEGVVKDILTRAPKHHPGNKSTFGRWPNWAGTGNLRRLNALFFTCIVSTTRSVAKIRSQLNNPLLKLM